MLVFILLVCVAYGAAIHITFRQEKETPEEFSSFIRTVLAMCEHAFGDLELKDFWNTENRAFATALASSYIIIMGEGQCTTLQSHSSVLNAISASLSLSHFCTEKTFNPAVTLVQAMC